MEWQRCGELVLQRAKLCAVCWMLPSSQHGKSWWRNIRTPLQLLTTFAVLVSPGLSGRRNPRSVPTCKIPNVYVKLSAFYALGNATPPYDDMLPFVASLRDAFGARRLMGERLTLYQEHQHSPPFNQNAQSNQTCKFEPRQRLIVVHLACVIWSMIATDARAWLLCNYAGGGSVLLGAQTSSQSP